MRLTFNNKDGTVDVVESAHSGSVSYRVGGVSDTFDQGDLKVIYLDSIESLEVSGHAEAPKPEKPLPTKQVEMSAAEFFMGPVNMKYGTDKAQEQRVILTMRKPTEGKL